VSQLGKGQIHNHKPDYHQVKEIEVVNTRWLENMSFETEINGHKIIMDGDHIQNCA
jgi:hypothetical protein